MLKNRDDVDGFLRNLEVKSWRNNFRQSIPLYSELIRKKEQILRVCCTLRMERTYPNRCDCIYIRR